MTNTQKVIQWKYMSVLTRREQVFWEAVAGLAYCNPFSPRRPEFERAALGEAFRDGEPAWSLNVDDPAGPLWNGEEIARRVERELPGFRDRLSNDADRRERRIYEDAVMYHLYYSYSRRIYHDPHEPVRKAVAGPVGPQCYEEYLAEWRDFFRDGIEERPEHIFAIFYQMRRAFFAIYRHIIGSSAAAARLRAAVWQSIFTCDLRRYRDGLFSRMGDFSTLITGPSGTGKELVARAIALSRYVPFDAGKLAFAAEPNHAFQAVNLAALSPTLIESELFGHRKGSFTGAIHDRVGWLDDCPAHGTVFLDEIGELDKTIQVKLLRVIQMRQFQRVGETADREFRGKIVAATNRNLADAIERGEFRQDFYYRLCSDLIETVSLAEQLKETPGTLRQLVAFLSRRAVGEGFEAAAREAEKWIEENLGEDYSWPGNYRELEQCVRNVLIRGEYRPLAERPRSGADRLMAEFRDGRLTADEMLSGYCTLAYSRTRNYAETARRLGLDQRTVKAKVDRRLLAELQ